MIGPGTHWLSRALFAAALALSVLPVAGAVETVRHLGSFGDSCPVTAPPAGLPATESPAGTPPAEGQPLRLAVVIDPACPATVTILDAVRDFRQSRPDVAVELYATDLNRFRQVPEPDLRRLVPLLEGLEAAWRPDLLARWRVRAVPYVRLWRPDGASVSAVGTPNLHALLGGLR